MTRHNRPDDPAASTSADTPGDAPELRGSVADDADADLQPPPEDDDLADLEALIDARGMLARQAAKPAAPSPPDVVPVAAADPTVSSAAPEPRPGVRPDAALSADLAAAPPASATEAATVPGLSDGTGGGAPRNKGGRPRGARPRCHGDEYDARVGPDTVFKDPAARVVDVVRALGVVALGNVVAVAKAVDGRDPANTYRASTALEAAGVIRKVWVRRDLAAARVPGIGVVLRPGPEWKAWHEQRFPLGIGAPDEGAIGGAGRVRPEPLEDTASELAVREHLALTTEVLRRITEGWQMAEGDRWLVPATKLALEAMPPTGPGVALTRALAARRVRVDASHTLVGLLPPPTGTGRPRAGEPAAHAEPDLPCVVVGGGWMTRHDFVRVARTLGFAAPYEVLAAGRSQKDADTLRRLVWKHTARDRGYCPLTTLRITQYARWKRTASGLDSALRVTANGTLRSRLGTWLTMMAAA
jgi:hypothetical protein